MYFVYFLRSESRPEQTYIGITTDLNRRIGEHNSEENTGYTCRYRPWIREAFVLAESEEVARIAEAYFKNSSGKEKIKNFADVNPDHPNPVKGFIDSLEEGRAFGRGENRFKVEGNILVSGVV